MNLEKITPILPLHSRQKISVWDGSRGMRLNLDSVCFGINSSEYSQSRDCVEFLTSFSSANQLLLQRAAYNFRVYFTTPEKLELKDGLWVFPREYCHVDCFSDNKFYEKYLAIARANGLV